MLESTKVLFTYVHAIALSRSLIFHLCHFDRSKYHVTYHTLLSLSVITGMRRKITSLQATQALRAHLQMARSETRTRCK